MSDYFDDIKRHVRSVFDAIDAQDDKCVLPENLREGGQYSEEAQRIRAEFQKKQSEIDKKGREAIGALFVGLLSDIHTIAVAAFALDDVQS